ncbi:MAG: Fe-S cluster assembly protein SufD [Cyclobacteriaceae bacterium]|jgi:Fe-S cluster assembly protein SufD
MSVTSASPLSKDTLAALPSTANDGWAELRAHARSVLLKNGLPGARSEEYRFTPVLRSLEKNFTPRELVHSNKTSAGPEPDRYQIPGLDAYRIVFINGQFDISRSTDLAAVPGVNLRPIFNSKPMLSLADVEADSFTALNTGFGTHGLAIEIAPGTVLDKPIFVWHGQHADAVSAYHTRLQIKLGASSEATLIEKFDTEGKADIFHTFVEEIDVAERAKLQYCKIQNDVGSVTQVANTVIRQADNSRIDTFTFTFDGKLVRNNFQIVIDGENCESHFFGLYLVNGTTLVDNHTVVDHKKPNSFSNEMYKGVMDGQSKGVFNGKIYVRPHAQKTNAFQSNRNILLSDSATVNTKPQLEIWADDVKCSHGCTSGQLDEEAMFYLQSRGISKSAARAMLLYAFAGEVIQPLFDETLKQYIDQLVSQKLH